MGHTVMNKSAEILEFTLDFQILSWNYITVQTNPNLIKRRYQI